MRVIDYVVIKDIDDFDMQVKNILDNKEAIYYKRYEFFVKFSNEWKSHKNKLVGIVDKIDKRIFCMYFYKLDSIYQRVVNSIILGNIK